MAIRDDFTAGEVLAAADLNDTFAAKLNLAGGKILQIVRATDATARSTTSTSPTDVTGMSVTITPQKSDSAVLLLASFNASVSATSGAGAYGKFKITDSSNNNISGAQEKLFGSTTVNVISISNMSLFAYSTPATTSATTYKLRFWTDNVAATVTCGNDVSTGQMYAIEVSA